MINIILDRELEKPLYAQIRDAVILAIEHRKLTPGENLPTIAALAKELDVTQATILRAFEDLSKENYIISQVGRGTFINDREHTGGINVNPSMVRFTQSAI